MKSFLEFILESTDEDDYEPIQVVFGHHNLETPHLMEKLNRHVNLDHEHEDQVKNHNKFTPEEGHKINEYTEGSYGMNKYLHGAGKAKKDPYEGLNKDKTAYLHSMDNIVHRHKAHKAFHVYTGVSKEHDIHRVAHNQGAGPHKPIKVVHHGFMSTSIDKHVAKGYSEARGRAKEKPRGGKTIFGHDEHHYRVDEKGEKHRDFHHHILKIHVPKGQHGAYTAHHSYYPDEREYILPRGTKLHIHHKASTEMRHEEDSRNGKKEHEHHHYHIWHARIHKD
jgi:hypothetical protein